MAESLKATALVTVQSFTTEHNAKRNNVSTVVPCKKSRQDKSVMNASTFNYSAWIAHIHRCPNPMYMEGAHCEKIRCANDAILHIEPNGTWHCDCSQKMFYKGVFCEV